MVRKRKVWSRTGVSDIVANLLILAITVVLFSSIIMFVSSMPTPKANTYGDFTYTLKYKANTYANVTLKHVGGPSLPDATTKIFFMTNTSRIAVNISDSDPDIGKNWNLGLSCSFNLTQTQLASLGTIDKLQVMIVDMDRNMIVWTGTVLDNSSSTSIPIILDRYLAEFVSGNIWVRANAFYDEERAALFVQVYDGGNDMPFDGVKANLTALGIPDKLTLYDNNGDGWYSAPLIISTSAIGDAKITINATDAGHRSTEALLTVTLYSKGGGGGGGGGHGNGTAPGDLYFSNLQGVNLFRYSDFYEFNYSAKPTSSFVMADKKMTVLVASKMVLNIENINELCILNQQGAIVTAVSTPNVHFAAYDFFSGYYVYTADVDLTGLTDNANYFAQINLRDTRQPINDQFFAVVPFKIGTPTAPVIQTYKDAACTVKTTDFTTTQFIYVKITGAPVGLWSQSAGLVEVTDYAWNMQIMRIPDGTAGNPVSTLTRDASDTTVYTFKVNLSAAAQYPWIPGKNAYMLRYDRFTVAGSSYLLSIMVNITAPRVLQDIVSGIDSVKGGWADGSLIEYYSNNNQWIPPDFIQSWDGKHLTTYDEAQYVRLGNIRNNGKLDIVAVVLAGTTQVINLYLNDGSWTPVLIDEGSGGRGTITSIGLGSLDTTGGDDIIVGYSTGEVGFYRNDGTWGYTKIGKSSTATAVTQVVAVDTTNTTGTHGSAQSEDVIAGYASSSGNTYPIHIFSNTNLDGSNWADTPYVGQVSNIVHNNATSENKISSYLLHGNYLDSRYYSGGYEAITEVNKTASFYARSTNPSVDNGANFAIPSGSQQTQSVWNSWNITPTSSIVSVRLEVSYYSSGDWKTKTPTFEYTVPGGAKTTLGTLAYQASPTPKVMSWTLSGVSTDSKLFGLNITCINPSNSGYSVTFQYWRLYVTYSDQTSVMEHVWNFQTTAGGSNNFAFTAETSTVLDTFVFQYAVGAGAYTSFTPSLVVSTESYVRYTYALPLTTASTTFHIKVQDQGKLDGPATNTTLYVKDMCINTTLVTAGSIGLPVRDIQIYDMDLNGYDDLVIADSQNIWLCYNYKVGTGRSFTSVLPTRVTEAAAIPNILNIGCGIISSANKYPGVIIATSDSPVHIYTILPDATSGTFNAASAAKSLVTGESAKIIKMVAADIDGDGDLDFVIATSTTSNLVYYRNDGSGAFNRWLIDTLPSAINDIALGKLQNN